MIPSENIEAETLANWLRIHGYIFTHIANESGLPPRVAMLAGARKKRMGVSPGVPDFMICLKRKNLLFIELKRQKKILKSGKQGASPSKVSKEQEEWIERINECIGVGAYICYGANESIKLIEKLENL